MPVSLTAEQRKNAEVIVYVGRSMGFSDAAVTMALSVAWSESRLRNLDHGDRDSLGLFQQRPSQGWGTPQQILDPAYAARKFFEAARPVIQQNPNMPMAEVAWRVQRPATRFRGMYGDNMGTATEVFSATTGAAPANTPSVAVSGGEEERARNRTDAAAAPMAPPRPTPAATEAVSSAEGFVEAGGTAGAPPTTLPPNASPAEIEAFVRENYPGAAYLLRASDETRMLVIQAAQQGWSADRLRGAIEKTQWYRTQSETERQWRETVDTDPATAAIRRQQQQSALSDRAARLGAQLAPEQMAMVVEGSLRFGWTQQQIDDVLAGFVSTTKPTGDARTILQNLRAMSADYAVPVDRKTLQFWTDKIIRGEQDEEDFVGFLRGQAIGMFKGNDAVVKQIESGFNVRQIAAGSLGWAAKELDIADPSTMDLTDPKWLRLIHHFDPETKTFRPMDAADVISTVRTKRIYGYAQSLSGRQSAAQLATELRQMTGIQG